jgi:hypothetical protein
MKRLMMICAFAAVALFVAATAVMLRSSSTELSAQEPLPCPRCTSSTPRPA